ncbi:MAG: hypothetical protein WA755_04515 [Candidatus Acidiferrales bacterium]
MIEFSPPQISILERLRSLGFSFVAFPMYANHIGVKRANCVALIALDGAAGFHVFSEPSWLIEGNLSVKITDAERQFFVWKRSRVEATPDRLAELAAFSATLAAALEQSTD